MRQLLQLPGIGPYGACNLLQLLGCYSHVPCDSETVRHLQAVHGLRRADLKNVRSLADQVRCTAVGGWVGKEVGSCPRG